MKYSVQINNNSAPWVPGIYGFKSFKAAKIFKDCLTKLSVKCCILKKNTSNNWISAE